MDGQDYAIRDTRTYHAWQSQDALRALYEKHDGVESRNLVALYVALTLKATYCGFNDTYHTTSKDICDYTHLSHDFVPQGLRLLEEDGLVVVQDRRDVKGYMLGKTVTLTEAPKMPNHRLQKTGTSFLGGYEYNVKGKEYSESKDSSSSYGKKEVSEDTIEASPEPAAKGVLVNEHVWDDFKDIFAYGEELALFPQIKVSYESGAVRIPQYAKHALQKLILLSQNKFNDSYKIKSNKVNNGNWREMVNKALDNLKIIKEDARVWPEDKSRLPKNLDAFLYNTRTGFSWFMKCLEPVATQKEDLVNEKYGDIVKDEHAGVFKDWFDYYFYELNYEQTVDLKRNIGELLQEHGRLWNEYGQYYTKIGKWHQYLGGSKPEKFLKVFADFLLEHKFTAHEASVRPASKAFDAFKRWLHKEYDLNLDMSTVQRNELVAKAEGKTIAVNPTIVNKMPALDTSGVLTGDMIEKNNRGKDNG